MDEKEKKANEQGDGIPPCSLVLHSPYMTDAQRHYVGGVSDPLLIQCTYAAELKNEVPLVHDRYLSFSDRTDLYWHPGVTPDPAIPTEYPAGQHRHDLGHHHYSGHVGGVTRGQKSCDENDIGSADDSCAPHHGHELSLDDAELVADEETDPEFYDPLHYEISAYYVDPNQGQEASVPAGMIVFTHADEPEGYEGWQRMDKQPLQRDRRETDPHYQPRLWWNELLRIVGCLPSKYRKGRRTHTHEIAEHYHEGGEAYGSAPTVDVDDSTGRFFAARGPHSHPLSHCSTATESLKAAENLRRHKRMVVYMAARNGA